jgi:hypothetical protein
VGHFDGRGGAPLLYEAHPPMQHDQGFTGSHWTPPSGDYSLRIAPAAARATINTTSMQNVPTLLAVLMAIAMRRYYTACIARWRRFMAIIKATKRCHRALAISIAMAMRWYDAGHIARQSTSRASLGFTGCLHQASACAVSPRRPPWSKNLLKQH